MRDDLPELKQLLALPAAPPEGLADATWDALTVRFGFLDDIAVAAAGVDTARTPAENDTSLAPPGPEGVPPVPAELRGHAARRPAGWFRPPWVLRRPAPRWAPALAGVVALVVASTLVLLGGPSGRSAWAVVTEARERFAAVPPLHVVVEQTAGVAPLAGEFDGVTEAWTTVRELQWRDRSHYREQILDMHGAPPGWDYRGVSDTTVADGTYEARYDARKHRLFVAPVGEASGAAAVIFIDPELQGEPGLDDATIREDCRVEADVEILDRTARVLSCAVGPIPQEGLPAGSRATVAIDRETGIVLEMRFPNGSSTVVRSIELDPDFADDAFRITVPEGATVDWVGRSAPPPEYAVTPPTAPGGGDGGDAPPLSSIAIRGNAQDLVVAHGSLWVSVFVELGDASMITRQGHVLRIDPRTGEAVEIPIAEKELSDAGRRELGETPERYAAAPSGLVSAGGWIWVVDSIAGTLERIDPATNQATGDPIRVGVDPRIASGAGSLWVLTGDEMAVKTFAGVGVGVSVSRLVRLDPATGAAVAEVPLSERTWLWTSVVATDAAVWVAVHEVDPSRPRETTGVTLLRIDPAGNRVVARSSVLGSRLAVTDDAVWVGALGDGDGAPGSVERVDPASGEVAVRIPIANGLEDIVAAGGSIWATNPWSDTVTRIDPKTNTVSAALPAGDQPAQIGTDGVALWVLNVGSHTVVRVPL